LFNVGEFYGLNAAKYGFVNEIVVNRVKQTINRMNLLAIYKLE